MKSGPPLRVDGLSFAFRSRTTCAPLMAPLTGLELATTLAWWPSLLPTGRRAQMCSAIRAESARIEGLERTWRASRTCFVVRFRSGRIRGRHVDMV